MFLVIDVETSGLLERHLPLNDPRQPWAVSLAAALCEDDGAERDLLHVRIRSDGRKMHPKAVAVHGISDVEAATTGMRELIALSALLGLTDQAARVVGHGVDYDRQVIHGLLLRAKKPVDRWLRPGLEWIDTMRVSTALCQIPSQRVPDEYKWPTLDEAGERLCGLPHRAGKHSALDDVRRTRTLYLHLIEVGAIESRLVTA